MMKGGENKIVVEFIFIMIILILVSPFINAGPYGYGDSMDLKYRIAEGKIYYGYGNENSTKYTTSLRPKDANISTWKADSRREVVNSKFALEIFKEEEIKKSTNIVSENNDGFLVPSKGIKYEDKILREFDKLNQTDEIFVWVVIYLKNSSDVSELPSIFSKDEIKDILHRPISPNKISAKITKSAFDKLIQDERVDRVFYNGKLYFSLDDSAPLINATYVINTLGYTGKGIKVCVIDSGVDKFHPALVGKIAGEKCYCANNCCPPSSTNESNNATDNVGQGTHVAGIIASQNQTYRGIAPNVSIYVVKVGATIDALQTDVGDAINWCNNQGVNIISMSLANNVSYPGGGESCPTFLNTEINNAYNSGIVLIAASGNSNYKNGTAYPACQSNVISVGATYKDDTFWDVIISGTNRDGNLPTLLAPGVFILSTAYDWRDTNIYFQGKTGTSMSAPHVAGAVALLLEKDSSLSPDEIEQLLIDTGKPIYDSGTDTTYPRINVGAAINSVCIYTAWSSGS